ncbi:nucleotidyltransferase domain-containing protein [Candidatus Woesearchaeota archaeon]|nr:nucleotidyltransferase domain-containing protein [Candidatus Woesearchaeota archaeon]
MVISNKERGILIVLFKDFASQYNARSISKLACMTPRGALKALKNLENQNFVVGKPFGKAIQYKLNFNALTKKTLELLLLEEAELKYKRWREEFKDFNEAEIIILFGSVLRKEGKHNDIDVVFVFNKENYKLIMHKVDEKNEILPKKIHAVIQTPADLRENITKKDPVIIDAIRTGIVMKGYEKLVEQISEVIVNAGSP